MTIIRYQAGDEVPADGMYVLVGHYGEASGIAVWRRKGERLPLTVVSEPLASPLWFVRIAQEATVRTAA